MKLLLAGLLLFPAPAIGQQVFIDMDSELYAADSLLADSLARTTHRLAYQLGLAEWRIFIHFGTLDKDGLDILASTSANPIYRTAHITIDLPDLKTLTHWSREETLRHELLHIVLWEYVSYIQLFGPQDSSLRQLLRNMTEKITTHLTRMPLWREKDGNKN